VEFGSEFGYLNKTKVVDDARRLLCRKHLPPARWVIDVALV
jgi:hypothetical protein